MPSARSSTSSAAVSSGRRSSPEAARRDTLVLGAGALGLAWSLTTTSAYLPPILGRYTDSTTLVGLVLAAEGFFALTLPLVIGPWSDTFHTPLGRRRPFMLVGARADGVHARAARVHAEPLDDGADALGLFFAYYVYEPPYRGLYPDVLPESVYGRAQGVQHVFRGIAIGGALIGGGYLFHLWQPGPVPRRGRDRVRGLRDPDPARHRGRGPRPRLRGGADVREAGMARAPLEPGRRDVSRREHGLGGDIRRRADVRGALRHRRARRAARHVDVHPRRGRRRLHRGGAARGSDR